MFHFALISLVVSGLLFFCAWTLRYFYLNGVLQLRPKYLAHIIYCLLSIGVFWPVINSTYLNWNREEVVHVKKVENSQEIPLYLLQNGQVQLESIGPQNSNDVWREFAFLSLVSLIGLFQLISYLRELWILDRIRKTAVKFRGVGKVQLMTHVNIRSPFSFSSFYNHYIMIPESYLVDSESLKLSVLHELSHVRQGHTIVAHVLQWMLVLFGWNPFIRGLVSIVNSIQEFSCDEALLKEKAICPKIYGQLLIAAVKVPASQTSLNCAPSMVGGAGKKLLTWRIILMVRKKRFKSKIFSVGLPIFLPVFFSGAAIAATDILSDGIVTMKEAYELVETAKGKSQIPLYVDEFVVEKLNQFLVNKEGRAFMTESLSRLPFYKDTILSQIQAREMPEELIAIPLVESGFKNLPEQVNRVKGAGMWQIIPATGRRLGLDVNPQQDERLNLNKSTRAALDYLQMLYEEFGDWHLAMVAYNKGENGLRAAMDEAGTSNVTELQRSQKINDYISSTMAAILILQRPELVK